MMTSGRSPVPGPDEAAQDDDLPEMIRVVLADAERELVFGLMWATICATTESRERSPGSSDSTFWEACVVVLPRGPREAGEG